MTENTTPSALTHQIAELVTVALGELSLARQSAVSEPEFEDAVERAETALHQVIDPLRRLMAELDLGRSRTSQEW
jgi:hypothetical protein